MLPRQYRKSWAAVTWWKPDGARLADSSTDAHGANGRGQVYYYTFLQEGVDCQYRQTITTRVFRRAYHVTSRGDQREPIYEDDEDRRLFLAMLGELVRQMNWVCHAYCLMSNHYHLVVETPRATAACGATARGDQEALPAP
jgi:hypothetical protein